MTFKITDRRGMTEPQEVCRVCGSTDVHSKVYNKPTMDCIRYLRNELKPKEQFTFFYGGEFSQWYYVKFDIEGVTYNCAEQFMMAMKALHFKDYVTQQAIMDEESPREQKALGRTVKNFNAIEWTKVGIGYVYLGNYAKFTQHKHLKQILLNTKGTTLVEASPYDRIWGIGLGMNNPLKNDKKNWRGKNLLGIAITQVRDTIMKGNI